MLIGYYMPAYHDTVNGAAMRTYRDCAIWANRNGHTWSERIADVHPLDRSRNAAIKWSLAEGHDLLLMQDSDCHIEEGPAIQRLRSTMLETDAAVVSLALPCRRPRENGSARPNCYPMQPGETYEAETCGTGIILFDMVKLRDLPLPWFRFVLSDDGCDLVTGEDTYFARKAKAAGYRVVVDWTIPAYHDVRTSISNMPRGD